MRRFITALFNHKSLVDSAKDLTASAVKSAVEQNMKASAKLAATIRELMEENNRLRANETKGPRHAKDTN